MVWIQDGRNEKEKWYEKQYEEKKNIFSENFLKKNFLNKLSLLDKNSFKIDSILNFNIERAVEILATKNLTENLNKLNCEFKENPLVKKVIEFITKDKKRSICTPFSKE